LSGCFINELVATFWIATWSLDLAIDVGANTQTFNATASPIPGHHTVSPPAPPLFRAAPRAHSSPAHHTPYTHCTHTPIHTPPNDSIHRLIQPPKSLLALAPRTPKLAHPGVIITFCHLPSVHPPHPPIHLTPIYTHQHPHLHRHPPTPHI
jgi:hypothetical protein